MRLLPLEVWFQPVAAPLLPQLRQQLDLQARLLGGAGARPLRWAITAADPQRGLRLEAMVLVESPLADQGSSPADPPPGSAAARRC